MSTAAAIRSADYRRRRREGRSAELAALLEDGRRRRAELQAQARDAMALARLQARAGRLWDAVEHAASPAARARLLGELADALVARRDLIERARQIEDREPRRRFDRAEAAGEIAARVAEALA